MLTVFVFVFVFRSFSEDQKWNLAIDNENSNIVENKKAKSNSMKSSIICLTFKECYFINFGIIRNHSFVQSVCFPSIL